MVSAEVVVEKRARVTAAIAAFILFSLSFIREVEGFKFLY